MENLQKEITAYNKEMNLLMKHILQPGTTEEKASILTKRIDAILAKILNDMVPSASNNRVCQNQWMLNTNMPLKENQILLVCSCKNPIRSLVVVSRPKPSEMAKDVIPSMQYLLRKIKLKTLHKNFRGGREPGHAGQLVIGTLKPGYIYTTRRGWQAIDIGIANLGYTAACQNGNLFIRERDRLKLIDIYKKYVLGMTRKPIDSKFARDPMDRGIEQYLTQEYPTPEWAAHTNDDKLFRRPKDVYCEDEEEEEEEEEEGEKEKGRLRSYENTYTAPSAPCYEDSNSNSNFTNMIFGIDEECTSNKRHCYGLSP